MLGKVDLASKNKYNYLYSLTSYLQNIWKLFYNLSLEMKY